MSWSARKLEILGRFLVSGTVAIAFLGCIATLFVFVWLKIDIPPGTREILCLLIGVLAREFGDVCARWIDKDKDTKDESVP
jgi:hypothetical protein